MTKVRILFAILLLLNFLAISTLLYREIYLGDKTPRISLDENSAIESISQISGLDNGKYSGSFRTHDGTIYLKGQLKSSDGGNTVVLQKDIDVEELTRDAGLASISSNGLFYATSGDARLVQPGIYRIHAWRSLDELKKINEEEALAWIMEK